MSSQHLRNIKILHTAIWIFYNILIVYMFYAVITNHLDFWFWAAWGFILLEGLILVIFKWTCPLTLLARKHSSSEKDNFDIYLPNWLAKHTKTIYTGLSIIILVMTIFRLF